MNVLTLFAYDALATRFGDGELCIAQAYSARVPEDSAPVWPVNRSQRPFAVVQVAVDKHTLPFGYSSPPE
ncbi:MAG: hypothetical protein WDA07_13000 [Leucobacter sp.]